MPNILVIGATGSLARTVIATAAENPALHLTLFARQPRGLPPQYPAIAGDALAPAALQAATRGQDTIYINLAGDLGRMGANIVAAMQATGVRRVIAISSIGIYDTPVRDILRPYRALANCIENSGLDYTILRPDWFTDADEIDYQLTPKGEPECGHAVSRKSIADFVCKLFADPAQYIGANLNISKP